MLQLSRDTGPLSGHLVFCILSCWQFYYDVCRAGKMEDQAKTLHHSKRNIQSKVREKGKQMFGDSGKYSDSV